MLAVGVGCGAGLFGRGVLEPMMFDVDGRRSRITGRPLTDRSISSGPLLTPEGEDCPKISKKFQKISENGRSSACNSRVCLTVCLKHERKVCFCLMAMSDSYLKLEKSRFKFEFVR
jgi:hypothetical protein